MEAKAEDLALKFRMTGAFVWLLLLTVIVPSWYSHPVGFSPDMEIADSRQKDNQIVVDKPFVLPGTENVQQITGKTVVPEPLIKQSASKVNDKMPVSKSQVVESQDKKPTQASTATQAQDAKAKSPALKEQWILRVAAYRSKEKANLLYEHLKYDYDVFVKYFPQSQYYSVRIGPYADKKLAIRDQKELNRVLRVHSELAKMK